MKTFSYRTALLFSVTLLSLPISVTAQAPHVDTIFTGVSHREPTLYYWGTNWVDMYPSWCGFIRATINDYSTEMARYCEVDSGYHLNVIGIAAPIEYYIPSGCYDTSISNRDPEYFNLYKPGPNEGDTLVMNRLASARWDNCTPRYRMEIIKRRQGQINDRIYPYLFEAYFGKAVSVTDSFYVSVTNNNNHFITHDPETGAYVGHVPAHVYNTLFYIVAHDHLAYPSYMRGRALKPDGTTILDSLWMIGSTKRTSTESFWLAIFPIFDTADYNEQLRAHAGTLTDSVNCDTVTGFRLLSVDDLGATFTWNGSYTGHWELSYAPYPQPADSGTIVTVTSPFRMIADVDTGVTYQAFVRQVCDDTLRSPWSSPIPFVVHREQQSIDNTPSMPSVQVWPNPASQQVTLFSSFYIRSFAVYTIDGRLIDSHTVHATTTTLDVSHYPKGSYIIRTHTSYGDVTNRIVVK